MNNRVSHYEIVLLRKDTDGTVFEDDYSQVRLYCSQKELEFVYGERKS